MGNECDEEIPGKARFDFGCKITICSGWPTARGYNSEQENARAGRWVAYARCHEFPLSCHAHFSCCWKSRRNVNRSPRQVVCAIAAITQSRSSVTPRRIRLPLTPSLASVARVVALTSLEKQNAMLAHETVIEALFVESTIYSGRERKRTE